MPFHTRQGFVSMVAWAYSFPKRFSMQRKFPKGNVPAYVCNHGSPREQDAATRHHTSCIPASASFTLQKLPLSPPHVLLYFLVATSSPPVISPRIPSDGLHTCFRAWEHRDVPEAFLDAVSRSLREPWLHK